MPKRYFSPAILPGVTYSLIGEIFSLSVPNFRPLDFPDESAQTGHTGLGITYYRRNYRRPSLPAHLHNKAVTYASCRRPTLAPSVHINNVMGGVLYKALTL